MPLRRRRVKSLTAVRAVHTLVLHLFGPSLYNLHLWLIILVFLNYISDLKLKANFINRKNLHRILILKLLNTPVDLLAARLLQSIQALAELVQPKALAARVPTQDRNSFDLCIWLFFVAKQGTLPDNFLDGLC